jgi:hypothetical protein
VGAKPVDLDAPTYEKGRMIVKTRGGNLVMTTVPDGARLKTSNHVLSTNQKWDVMLTRVAP